MIKYGPSSYPCVITFHFLLSNSRVLTICKLININFRLMPENHRENHSVIYVCIILGHASADMTRKRNHSSRHRSQETWTSERAPLRRAAIYFDNKYIAEQNYEPCQAEWVEEVPLFSHRKIGSRWTKRTATASAQSTRLIPSLSFRNEKRVILDSYNTYHTSQSDKKQVQNLIHI